MIYFKYIEDTRLGNWLFQYGAAVSLSETSVTCIVSRPEIRTVFEKQPFFAELRYTFEAPRNVAVFKEKSLRYERIPYNGGPLVLEGYFQSPRYLNQSRIQKLFAIPEALRRDLLDRYGEVLSEEHVTSISVRRTDYLDQPAYHPFVGESYYRKAIAMMPEARHFIVCSDDVVWCRAFFTTRNFPGRTFVISDCKNAIEDLYLISLCKNNIICNSSFSWWGAYLNQHAGKRTIAPSLWYGLGYVERGVDWQDIYMKGCEIVDNGYTTIGLMRARWQLAWTKVKVLSVKLRDRYFR